MIKTTIDMTMIGVIVKETTITRITTIIITETTITDITTTEITIPKNTTIKVITIKTTTIEFIIIANINNNYQENTQEEPYEQIYVEKEVNKNVFDQIQYNESPNCNDQMLIQPYGDIPVQIKIKNYKSDLLVLRKMIYTKGFDDDIKSYSPHFDHILALNNFFSWDVASKVSKYQTHFNYLELNFKENNILKFIKALYTGEAVEVLKENQWGVGKKNQSNTVKIPSLNKILKIPNSDKIKLFNCAYRWSNFKSEEKVLQRLFEILPNKVKSFEVHGFEANLRKYPEIDPHFFEKIINYIENHLLRAASRLKSISICTGKLLDEGMIIIDNFNQNLSYIERNLDLNKPWNIKKLDLSLNYFGASRTKHLVEQLISTGAIYCFDEINLDDNSKSYDYKIELKEAMSISRVILA